MGKAVWLYNDYSPPFLISYMLCMPFIRSYQVFKFESIVILTNVWIIIIMYSFTTALQTHCQPKHSKVIFCRWPFPWLNCCFLYFQLKMPLWGRSSWGDRALGGCGRMQFQFVCHPVLFPRSEGGKFQRAEKADFLPIFSEGKQNERGIYRAASLVLISSKNNRKPVKKCNY